MATTCGRPSPYRMRTPACISLTLAALPAGDTSASTCGHPSQAPEAQRTQPSPPS
jgi:hypothetical protein